MICITLSDKLIEILKTKDHNFFDHNKLESKLFINYENIVRFYQKFKPFETFIEFLSKTSSKIIIIEKEKKPLESKEYLDFMEDLRIKKENQRYRKILKINDKCNFICSDNNDITRDSTRNVYNQLSVFINILVSFFSVMYFIWISTTNSTLSELNRIFLCIVSGIIILIADAYLWFKHFQRVINKTESVSNVIEKKKIIKLIIIKKNLKINDDN